VPKNARFIRVSLSQQTLVAYDGPEPVFATLVSTGKEGFETPQGLFRIQQKHVSATMDGLVGSDEAYSIEDVPWTMYFTGSIALHAAFWHDHFGEVHSHGCVNLAPADARWLFRFTTPVLPSGYHGVVAGHDNPGTWVAIDP
jgi:lipoprotein-anchoring transpeptidase ErfK/SrfK